MIIGLIADTHDNIYMIDKAVQRFNDEKVGYVLHAGDYIAPFTAKHFEPLNAKMIGVYGNNCAEHETLRKVYADVGAEIVGYFAELEIDDRKIFMYHSHRGEDRRRAEEGDYDVIITAHSHRVSVRKEDTTMYINPGEACGYITGHRTIAFLDTKKMFAWISELD